MRCPHCQSENHHETRATPTVRGVRRLRACDGCGEHFTTFERVEGPRPAVYYPDGQRADYDPSRLYYSLDRALTRLPESARLGEMLDEVEAALYPHSQSGVLPAALIGETALRVLTAVNPLAAARYGDGLRGCQTLDDLMAVCVEVGEGVR